MLVTIAGKCTRAKQKCALVSMTEIFFNDICTRMIQGNCLGTGLWHCHGRTSCGWNLLVSGSLSVLSGSLLS